MKAVLLLIMLPAIVAAFDAGLSPPRVDAPYLLPGSHLEKEILLSASSNILFSTDCACDWVSIQPQHGTMTSRAMNITLIADIPSDAASGTRNCSCHARFQVPGRSYDTAIELPITITGKVSHERFIDCRILHAGITDDGRQNLSLLVDNRGNEACSIRTARIAVKGPVDREYQMTFDKEIPPFTKSRISAAGTIRLPEGQYRATVNIEGKEIADPVYFDVIDAGILARIRYFFSRLAGSR